MTLDISKVNILPGNLDLPSHGSIVDLERKLGVKLPDGYPEYILKFGNGVLGGSLVRIYVPEKISATLTEWRERISEYWLWDDPKSAISKERAIESILIGETTIGDELIFHPSERNKLYILPRQSYGSLYVGENLLEAIEWMCSSGKLVRKFKKRDFQPY
jgi:hypothetical protein